MTGSTSPGIQLEPNKTYHVVLTGVSVDDGNTYHRTNSDDEDANSKTGWSLGDRSLFGERLNTWSNSSWQIAIRGNRPPNEIPDQTVPVGLFSYTFPANTFTDADVDTLVYTATLADGSALPSWLTFDAATRTFSGTPKFSDTGTVSVKVTASDGTASVSDTFDITVSETLVSNTGQSSTGVSTFFTHRAQPFTTGSNAAGYTLTSVSFPIIGNTMGSGLAVRIARSSNDRPGGSLGSLALSADGTTVTGTTQGIDLAANTTYFAVLTGNDTGTSNGYRGTLSDDEDPGAAAGWSIGDTSRWSSDFSLTSQTAWKIAIKGAAKSANNAPTVANEIPDRTLPVDTAFRYTFPANTFADADAGTTLTYTATRADGTALPAWLTFAPSTRTFSGNPQPGDAGTVSVKVTASDGTASVSDTFDITVDPTLTPTPVDTLVSNTGQSSDGVSTFFTVRAQPFTTGSNGDGYTLTSVSFPIIGTTAGSSLAVRIERSSNNRPGGSLGSLALSVDGTTVTGSTQGIDLAANTTYFVVLTGLDTGTSNGYRGTLSDDEDPGAEAGWSIGDRSLWSSGFSLTSDTAWKIAISGSVRGVQSAEAAYANGRTTLTFTFDRNLAAVGAPEPWDLRYAFEADGLYTSGNRRINLVPNRIETEGPRLRLIYNAAEALPGREVEVRYRAAFAESYLPSTLLYHGGQKVAGFTVTATRPTDDPIAPVLETAQVAGNVLTLTFDRALDASSAPAGSRFRLAHTRQDWEGETISIAGTGTSTVSGSTVTVTLASKVPQGRYARVAYVSGDDASPLRGDAAGPEVDDIWWRQAAVLDRDEPQLTGSLLVGTGLVLYYNEKLDTSSIPATGFYTVALAGNKPQAVTVSGVSVHAYAVELTLDWGTTTAGNVEVTYTPGASFLRDVAGNGAAGFANRSVTRQASDPGAPQFQSATAAATAVTVSFSRSLDPAHVPGASAFTLALSNTDLADAGYAAPTVTGVAVIGSDVKLAMNPWWYPCDGSLNVTYAVPTATASRLKSNWGTEVDAFTETAANAGKDQCVFVVVRGSVQVGGQSGGEPEGQSGPGSRDASGERRRASLQSERPGDAANQRNDASEAGMRIALLFDRALDPDSVPDTDAFTVTSHRPGAASIEVTDVEMPDDADDRLLLSLSWDLAGRERVTVSYRRPHGTSGLWDAQRNQVEDFSVEVTAPGASPNRPPIFNGVARRLDNALPGLLVSLPMRQSDFSDPDGDPLTFTLSASRDDVYALGGDVPGGFTYNDRVGRIFFLAKTACGLASLAPPTGDAYHTVITMTATDPGGETAHATATFRTDPRAFGCPSLSSAAVDGAAVTLTFDTDIAPSFTEPTAGQFLVKAGGVPVNVAEVSLAEGDAGSDSGDTISLTLASPVSAGQTVTVSYAAGDSAVAAAFADRPATNDTPAAQNGYEANQELIDDVWGYARETQHGPAHVERWVRVLQTLGVLDAMTASEAQEHADTYWHVRWDPVVAELEAMEADAGHTPDAEVVANVREYAQETESGYDHVLRWMRVLKTFGDIQDMTAAEAQENADTYSADRWDPVVEELKKLEASVP